MKFFSLFAVCVIFAKSTFAQDLPDREVYTIVEARRSQLQNLIVKYLSTKVPLPSPAGLQFEREGKQLIQGETSHVLQTPYSVECESRFLDSKVNFYSKLTEESIVDWKKQRIPGYPSRRLIITGERTESLDYKVDGQPNGGTIGAPFSNIDPLEMTIDYAIGMRAYGAKRWISNADLTSGKIDQKDSDIRITLTDRDRPLSHVWIFDRSNGFALKEYQVISPSGLFLDIVNSEFKAFQGVMLPAKIAGKQIGVSDGKPVIRGTFSIQVESYQLNDPKNTLETYEMTWPKGVNVLDTRIDKSITIRSGDRTLSDHDIDGALKQREGEAAAELQRAEQRIREATSIPATTPAR